MRAPEPRQRTNPVSRRMARWCDNPYRAILFGHTHLPYVREVEGTAFVNVGSAGRPKDGDWRACYALVDPSGPGEDGLAVDFVRVEWDHERLMQALSATALITSFDGPQGRPRDAEDG